jgi:hypothetical protein
MMMSRWQGWMWPGCVNEGHSISRGPSTIYIGQGWLSGLFVIEGDGTVLAQADKPNALTRRFEVTYGNHTLALTAQSPFTRAFGVYDSENQIGGIYPNHCFTRKTTIDLPDDIILPVKAFLFWLVVLMWRRTAHNRSHSP